MLSKTLQLMTPYLDIHTHHELQTTDVQTIRSFSMTKEIFELTPKIPNISIGLHPWYLTEENFKENFTYLEVTAKQTHVRLIGECGLDKLKGMEIHSQLKAFEQQIKLAEEVSKPVIIHCVKAFEELMSLKKRMKPNVPLIIHGFQKKAALAERLIRQGFYLSFGAGIFHNPSIAEFIRKQQLFFLETDDSIYRIQEIYDKVAEIKEITIDELKELIAQNWKEMGIFQSHSM